MAAITWRTSAAIVASVLLVLGLTGWLLRPRPDLRGVDALIAAGDHDAAEARIQAYLAVYPHDAQARLTLALLLVDRSEPQPRRAWDLLAGMPMTDPFQAARVRFVEGEARFDQGRYPEAESAWRRALRLDPSLALAGWHLLNLYAIQGRDDDSRRLGLQRFEAEDDPRDRVQLLLQLIRHDAHAIAPETIVKRLESVVEAHPSDHHSALALGRALVRESRFDAGTERLRKVVDQRPSDPEAWDVFLNGLVEAGRVDELTTALDRLPAAIAPLPRFDAARGWLAAQRQDWAQAAALYQRAWTDRPTDAVLAYRLQSALRGAGDLERLGALRPRLQEVSTAHDRLRGLWDQIDALPDAGLRCHADLYEQVATALEALGRLDEAHAWRRLDLLEAAERARASRP